MLLRHTLHGNDLREDASARAIPGRRNALQIGVVISALAIAAAGWLFANRASGHSQVTAKPRPKLVHYTSPDGYPAAIAKAQAASSLDEYHKAFRSLKSVSFDRTLVGGDADRATVRQDGTLLIVNRVTNTVGIFGFDGKQVGTIGGPSREKGYLSMARDATELSSDEIAVVDYRSRVLVYRPSGAFVRAILFARQKFSGHRILFDRSAGRILLFGASENYGPMAHEYSLSGKYKQSYLPAEPDATKRRLVSYTEFAVDADDGRALLAQQSPAFSRLGSAHSRFGRR